MKVFVLGRSGSGKTPMATQLASRVGLTHVRASAWARATCPALAPPPDASAPARAAFAAAITGFAADALVRDPWISIDHLTATAALAGPCVIEGVRNPLDFVHLFDPRQDVVIWLEIEGARPAPTAFERGLDVIAAYLDWQHEAGVRDEAAAPCWRYHLRGFRRDDPGAVAGATLDDAIADAAARLVMRPAVVAPARAHAQRVHAAIPPLELELRDEYLHGMDPARVGGFTRGRAFALTSHPGEAPTFLVRLPDGSLCAGVPVAALVDRARPGWGQAPTLAPADLVAAACPDERVVVHRFAALAGRVRAYFARPDAWVGGAYQLTVEWCRGDLVLHVVALDNGLVAMVPSRRLKFGGVPQPEVAG